MKKTYENYFYRKNRKFHSELPKRRKIQIVDMKNWQSFCVQLAGHIAKISDDVEEKLLRHKL